ncbi:MAG: glutamate racemase [Sphingomonadales bacterium]|jgi:glutamate racemase
MIGLFDSGTGGLTIASACFKALETEAFLYLGDHKRAPYGHRDNLEILEYTREAVACLFDKGCDLVVLACNTAAAIALRRLQQEWLPNFAPDKRILGILVPTVEAVTGVPWSAGRCHKRDGVIGIFATPKTVASQAYVEEVRKRAPNMEIIQIPCPGLVAAIETGADNRVLQELINAAVISMDKHLDGRELEAVLLGCTHYPLVKDEFKIALNRDVALISQPQITAESLQHYLMRHPRFIKQDREQLGISYLTTGNADQVTKTASRLCALDAVFQHVDLSPYASSDSSAGATSPSMARK